MLDVNLCHRVERELDPLRTNEANPTIIADSTNRHGPASHVVSIALRAIIGYKPIAYAKVDPGFILVYCFQDSPLSALK